MKPSNPAVVVLQPLDVVLSEVISALDFNDNNVLLPCVHDPMPCTLGNVHSLAALQSDLVFVDGHDGASPDYIPVLHSVTVPLETQALLRKHNNPFHFMVRIIGKDAEITPWPVLFRFWGHHTRCLILLKTDLERAAEKILSPPFTGAPTRNRTWGLWIRSANQGIFTFFIRSHHLIQVIIISISCLLFSGCRPF